MMLTPNIDRDSMWSMPLARVKKRSQGIGNVDFNVLRRHAGIESCYHHFRQIDGRKQVHGMRTTLVTPRTSSAKQQTTMKYGLRIENPGITGVHLFEKLEVSSRQFAAGTARLTWGVVSAPLG